MIGTSLPEYVFIRVCIFLLQYTTPICLACLVVLASVCPGGAGAVVRSLPGWLLLGYSIADLLYAVFIYIPYTQRLRAEAEHPPPLTRAERRAFLDRCLTHMPDPERYVREWFLGADLAEIRRDNLREFLLWAFFDRRPSVAAEEPAEDDAELDEYVALIEQKIGRRVMPGRGRAT